MVCDCEDWFVFSWIQAWSFCNRVLCASGIQLDVGLDAVFPARKSLSHQVSVGGHDINAAAPLGWTNPWLGSFLLEQWKIVCGQLWKQSMLAVTRGESMHVLLHCFGGINRSAGVLCAWLVVGYNYSCRGCPSCCLRNDLPCALGTIAPMSWRLCGNWKVCVPSGTWNSARRAETNLHHCSSGETEPARSVANCCLSVKTVRDEHVNSLVRPAVQKLKSVVSVCVIQLDDRRSHLGTSEQLCMIVQSEFSEVTLAPVWYRPGFLMDVFGLGLEVKQITGMCPALCYALRLALLSHNVSLRFQSMMVLSFSVHFRGNVYNKVT